MAKNSTSCDEKMHGFFPSKRFGATVRGRLSLSCNTINVHHLTAVLSWQKQRSPEGFLANVGLEGVQQSGKIDLDSPNQLHSCIDSGWRNSGLKSWDRTTAPSRKASAPTMNLSMALIYSPIFPSFLDMFATPSDRNSFKRMKMHTSIDSTKFLGAIHLAGTYHMTLLYTPPKPI